MKTKLIMLDTPIIVSDEEIKEEWRGLAYKSDVKGKVFKHSYTTNPWYKDAKKIIAGIEGLPSIDWNGLEEEFGWIDVDDLASTIADDIHENWHVGEERDCAYLGAVQGFKKAQSLNEKKFSLEDMFKCFQAGIDYEKEGSILQPDAHGYIQSLHQPKVFDIEIDGDWNKEFYELDNKKNVPKVWKPRITNNSIKILRKLH